MEKGEIREIIFTVTQSVIAIIVLAGAGIFLNAHPDSPATAAITGFVGVVLTFFFSAAMNNQATNNALKMQSLTSQSATSVSPGSNTKSTSSSSSSGD